MMARIALGLVIGLLGCLSLTRAQEATERFIPIGESPGLSGKYTVIGEIQATDSERRTITVTADDQTYTVDVTDRTRIWIDRSPLRLPALSGTLADCDRGLKIEVKFGDEEKRGAADWIKIRQAVR